VAVVLVDADITLLTVEAVNTTEAEETVEVFRSCFSWHQTCRCYIVISTMKALSYSYAGNCLYMWLRSVTNTC